MRSENPNYHQSGLKGEINSFVGPIIKTAPLIVPPKIFRKLKQYAPYTSAVILLIVVTAMPSGLVSPPQLARSST